MLTLWWARSDFWTWLILDCLWPVYFLWAFYLIGKFRSDRSSFSGSPLGIGFLSLLALVGLLHFFFGGARVLRGHEGYVRVLAFSPDGRFLASGSYDESIKIWDPITRKNLKTLWIRPEGQSRFNVGATPATRVTVLAFSPDARTLAAGSSEIVRLWDVETWQLRRDLWLDGFVNELTSLLFVTNGRLLVTNDNRNALRAVVSGIEIMGPGRSALSPYVSLSSDGKMLAAAYGNGVNLWNAETWNLRFHVQMLTKDRVTALAFSPDGRILAVGNAADDLGFWITNRWQSGPDVVGKVGCGTRVRSLAFSPNSKWLAASTGTREYDFINSGCTKLIRIQNDQFRFAPWETSSSGSLSFSPDSRTLAVSGGNSIELYRVD